MKIRELLVELNERISEEPWVAELPVFVARDAEGNDFRGLSADFSM